MTNSGEYEARNDGGTISFSGVKLNGNASSTASTDEIGMFMAAKTSTVTLTANAKSGYRFVGWYDTSNYQITGTGVSGNTYTYTVTGTKTVHARFIKQHTVTVSAASGVSGITPGVGLSTAASSTSSSIAVDAGSSVKLFANTPDGVTFTGWNGGGMTNDTTTPKTLTPTGNVNVTAGYQLNDFTASLSYAVKTVNEDSPPTVSASSTAGGTFSYSYSIARASGTTAASNTYSVGNTASNASTFGHVNASVPGNYTVTLVVTNSRYGLSKSKTVTANAQFKPATPANIEFTVSGYTYEELVTPTTGSLTDPYQVPNKTTISESKFKIAAVIPAADRISGYTYYWTMSNGTSTKTYGNTSTSCPETLDEAKNTGSLLIVNSVGTGRYYTATLTARCNGVDSTSLSATVYYDVITNYLKIESYEFCDNEDNKSVHKIYAEDNDITKIVAAYDTGLTEFDTVFFFSDNNLTYSPLEVWTNKNAGFTLDGTTYTATDNNHKVNSLIEIFNVATTINYTGVKYFKSYVGGISGSSVTPAQESLHTTVGTAVVGGDRPLYFVDNTGNGSGFAGTYRVMAFFLDSNNVLRYQTGQTMDSRSNTYRFHIPYDAVKVTFSYVAADSYVLPTFVNGMITYSVPAGSGKTLAQLFPAMTPTIDLMLDSNIGKNTYKADPANVCPQTAQDTNSIWQYHNANSDSLSTLED